MVGIFYFCYAVTKLTQSTFRVKKEYRIIRGIKEQSLKVNKDG